MGDDIRVSQITHPSYALMKSIILENKAEVFILTLSSELL